MVARVVHGLGATAPEKLAREPASPDIEIVVNGFQVDASAELMQPGSSVKASPGSSPGQDFRTKSASSRPAEAEARHHHEGLVATVALHELAVKPAHLAGAL